jgi:hypothetical protein
VLRDAATIRYCLDTASAKQIGQPFAVLPVRLVPRNLADACGLKVHEFGGKGLMVKASLLP